MINSESNKWRGRFIRYAPLFLWICVILIASSTTGAMSNTSRIIRPLLIWLFPNTPEEIITIYHGYIRKSAHFIEYGILAFWALRAFAGSSVQFLRKHRYLVSFIIVIFIASIDEYNQSFNSLRTSSINDVWLDCSGGLTVIFAFVIFRLLKNKG